MNHRFEHITKRQARIILSALRRNDARTIHPELGDPERWQELDDAFDLLRLALMDITDPEVTK